MCGYMLLCQFCVVVTHCCTVVRTMNATEGFLEIGSDILRRITAHKCTRNWHEQATMHASEQVNVACIPFFQHSTTTIELVQATVYSVDLLSPHCQSESLS